MFYKYLPNFNYLNKSKSHDKAVKKACLFDHHQQTYVLEMRYTIEH